MAYVTYMINGETLIDKETGETVGFCHGMAREFLRWYTGGQQRSQRERTELP